jgi:serine/threonine protein phosphatase 1
MAGRTFAIGDIHGDIVALQTVLMRIPAIDDQDTIVFLGDYIDRGPRSKEVVETVRDRHAPRQPRGRLAARDQRRLARVRFAAGKRLSCGAA